MICQIAQLLCKLLWLVSTLISSFDEITKEGHSVDVSFYGCFTIARSPLLDSLRILLSQFLFFFFLIFLIPLLCPNHVQSIVVRFLIIDSYIWSRIFYKLSHFNQISPLDSVVWLAHNRFVTCLILILDEEDMFKTSYSRIF